MTAQELKAVVVGLVGVLGVLGCIAVIAWATTKGVRAYERVAMSARAKLFADLRICPGPTAESCGLDIVTYHGLFLWFTQTRQECFVHRGDALELLRRVLRFNLTWGMTCYGLLFVPFLAGLAYWQGKRRVETLAGAA